MFDGRESSPATGTNKIVYNNYPNSLLSDLAHQSLDATVGHAQGDGTRPTPEERQQIVDFETRLFTAQMPDRVAGNLSDDGANAKMQFVIAFDQIDPNGKFHGVSKITLDMPRNDHSFLDERLAFNALPTFFGLPSSL